MGAFPRFAQSVAGFGSSMVVTLNSQVAVGDTQYVMVEANGASSTPIVWPAGWTVLFNAAAGPFNGRTSVAKRVRVAGDPSSFTVTGGTVGNWGASAFALKASGPNPASVAAEVAQPNTPGVVGVPTAALVTTNSHPTGIYMIACTIGNTITVQYPMVNPIIDGGAQSNAPPVLILPYSKGTIPAFTLTQSAAGPTFVYCVAAITTPDPIWPSGQRDSLAEYVRWTGYNKYPLKQSALGGGISVT